MQWCYVPGRPYLRKVRENRVLKPKYATRYEPSMFNYFKDHLPTGLLPTSMHLCNHLS